MERLSSCDLHAILELLEIRSHRLQILHNRRNAITLFNPQLFGIADDHSPLRQRTCHCQYRNLID